MKENLVLAELPSGKFYIIKGDLIGDYILRHGFWEIHLYTISQLFITKKDIVLDAGANIGFHTVNFSKLASKVYAFEPQKNIYDILTANLNLNECDNVNCGQFGLLDTPIKQNLSDIKYCTDARGQKNYGGLGITKDTNPEMIGEEIKCIDWDSMFPNEDITVIKIDVQGSELKALKGMEKMLKRCKPWILLENGDDEVGKETTDYLKELGYKTYRPLEKIPPEDCICLHDENPNHNELRKFISYISIFPVQFKLV